MNNLNINPKAMGLDGKYYGDKTASNGTNYVPCKTGHTWTFAGDTTFNLEGKDCDCGKVTYHQEQCKCCQNIIAKHIIK